MFLPYSFSPTTPHPCFWAFPSGCFPPFLADIFEACSCFQIQNSFNSFLRIFSAAQNSAHRLLSETLFSLASITLTFPESPILLIALSQLFLPHFLLLISKYSWFFFLKTFFFTSSFTLPALVALFPTRELSHNHIFTSDYSPKCRLIFLLPMGHLTSSLYSAHPKENFLFHAQKLHLLTPTLIQAPRNKISGSPSNPSSPSSSSIQSVDMLFLQDFAMSFLSAVSFLFLLPSNQFRHHYLLCGLLQGIFCFSSFPTSTYCNERNIVLCPHHFLV